MKSHGFVIALAAAIFLAFLFPRLLQALPLEEIIDVGIGFLFFFYGLRLAPDEIKKGLMNYPVHIVVHLGTFLLFPLLTMLFLPLFPEGTSSKLWLAVFFLGALPSTISSSVVMVALAKGNLPSAIFNASISGIIGIVATPLWLGLFMTKTGDFAIFEIMSKLFFQILLPLITGLLLQRYFGNFARKHSIQLGIYDKLVIILIVFSSFSDSFRSNLFQELALLDLLKIGGAVIILFFLVYFILGYTSKLMGFDTKDTITTKFCGTNKSLVHGSVMVKIIFGNTAGTGLFLMPIMLYHILQIVVISLFAEAYRKRQSVSENT